MLSASLNKTFPSFLRYSGRLGGVVIIDPEPGEGGGGGMFCSCRKHLSHHDLYNLFMVNFHIHIFRFLIFANIPVTKT